MCKLTGWLAFRSPTVHRTNSRLTSKARAYLWADKGLPFAKALKSLPSWAIYIIIEPAAESARLQDLMAFWAKGTSAGAWSQGGCARETSLPLPSPAPPGSIREHAPSGFRATYVACILTPPEAPTSKTAADCLQIGCVSWVLKRGSVGQV